MASNIILTSRKEPIPRKFSERRTDLICRTLVAMVRGPMKNSILPFTGQTLNQLQLKHPERKETSQEILVKDTPETIHPIKFERIDVEKIQKAAVKTQGGSGPSGMDADGGKQILTSKKFGKSSRDLYKAFSEVIKKSCSIENQSASSEASLACWLIPLYKNPGL